MFFFVKTRDGRRRRKSLQQAAGRRRPHVPFFCLPAIFSCPCVCGVLFWCWSWFGGAVTLALAVVVVSLARRFARTLSLALKKRKTQAVCGVCSKSSTTHYKPLQQLWPNARFNVCLKRGAHILARAPPSSSALRTTKRRRFSCLCCSRRAQPQHCGAPAAAAAASKTPVPEFRARRKTSRAVRMW